jgi:hypothetical protein
MNESAYMKALWRRIGTGKIGNQGQGYLDTGWLDSAFGGADLRRQLMLDQIGNRQQDVTQRLDLRDKALDYNASNNARRYDLANTDLSNQSQDALTGDIITGATIPIAYLSGRNQAKAIDEDRARQERINRNLESVLGRMP